MGTWLVAAGAVVACGEPSKPPNARRPAGPVDPRPVERVGDAVARVTGAATASTCTPIKGLLHSIYPIIGDAACRSVKAELGAFSGARGRAYGTGAVIDYRALAGQRKLMALALDSDRKFKVAFIEDAATPSIGTPKPPEFDAAASAVVRSMQTGDCDTFLRYVARGVGLGTGTDRQVCQRVSGEPLRRELMANRTARAVPMGGNAEIAFYKLRTTPTRYYTMVMVQRGGSGGLTPAGGRFVLVNAFPA